MIRAVPDAPPGTPQDDHLPMTSDSLVRSVSISQLHRCAAGNALALFSPFISSRKTISLNPRLKHPRAFLPPLPGLGLLFPDAIETYSSNALLLPLA